MDTLLTLARAGDLAHNCAEEPPPRDPIAWRSWVAEPKWDGVRFLAGVTEGGVRLFTRSGKDYSAHFPEVCAELSALPVGTWLDGEAVALTFEGGHMAKWGRVQSVISSSPERARLLSDGITFVAFDLLAHAGIDARPLILSARREFLERVLEDFEGTHVTLTPQAEVEAHTYDAMLAAGYEGMVLKSLTEPYRSGRRGWGWLKVKAKDTLDGVVMGFKPGENGFSGLVGSVAFGQYDGDGNLVQRGRCSGMDMRERRWISEHQDECLGRVMEVAFNVETEKGELRHARFKRWRDDKPAEECVIR